MSKKANVKFQVDLTELREAMKKFEADDSKGKSNKTMKSLQEKFIEGLPKEKNQEKDKVASTITMTIQDAAEYLNLSQSRIYALMKDGSIDWTYIGSNRYPLKESVITYHERKEMNKSLASKQHTIKRIANLFNELLEEFPNERTQIINTILNGVLAPNEIKVHSFLRAESKYLAGSYDEPYEDYYPIMMDEAEGSYQGREAEKEEAADKADEEYYVKEEEG